MSNELGLRNVCFDVDNLQEVVDRLAADGVWLVGGVVFFFQAEDGIRDLTVTGVQTCALPIWFFSTSMAVRSWLVVGVLIVRRGCRVNAWEQGNAAPAVSVEEARVPAWLVQIGRASCRERV